MRLAFDVTVSDREIGRLARLGHEIVCVAKAGERDEDWVERAYIMGAERIYSDDLDIPNLIDRLGHPISVRKSTLTTFLVKEVIA